MQTLPEYTQHKGTIRISGTTVPRSAGKCALHHFVEGVAEIDFLCIGANANQQATKSMGTFMSLVEEYSEKAVNVSFRPLEYLITPDLREGEAQLSEPKKKTATVWRTVIQYPGKCPSSTP